MAKNECWIIEEGITAKRAGQGKVRYAVRLQHKGRKLPQKTFDRLVDARKYKAYLLTLQHDSDRILQSAQANKLDFFSYIQQHWQHECRSNVSDGWRIDQDRMLRDYIFPIIGGMKLGDIKSRDVGAVIEFVRSKGRKEQMQRHVYNLLHKVFSDAIEHFEFLNHSPVLKRYCPRVPKRRRNFLHPKAAGELLTYVSGHFLEPAIMLGIMAGLRPGEIQALTWEAVDFDHGQIEIRAAFKRKVNRIDPYPKQVDWGVATMPKFLADCLESRRHNATESDFVAPGKGGGMLNWGFFYTTLKSLCHEAGVTVITPHELRHSCTELWIYNGGSTEDCRSQLNQSSQSAIETYIHRTDSRLRQMGESFEVPGLKSKQSSCPNLRLV